MSLIVPKRRNVASNRRSYKIPVSITMGYDALKLSFLRTALRFYSALALLEPHFSVEEQLEAENISLLSGCVVIKFVKLKWKQLTNKLTTCSLWKQPSKETSWDRPTSAPYLRLKNSKRTSKCQSIGEFRTFYEKKFFKNVAQC